MRPPGYVGSATEIGPVTPLSGLPSSLADLEGAINRLYEVVQHLDSRLEDGGVLRPSPPATGGSGQTPQRLACRLGEQVSQQTARVSGPTETIGLLLSRLDI